MSLCNFVSQNPYNEVFQIDFQVEFQLQNGVLSIGAT